VGKEWFSSIRRKDINKNQPRVWAELSSRKTREELSKISEPFVTKTYIELI